MKRRKKNPGKPNTSVKIAIFNAFEDEGFIGSASLLERIENYVADFLKQKSSVAIMRAQLKNPAAEKDIVALVRSIGIKYEEG